MSQKQEWLYIDQAGQQVGPIAADQIHAYVNAGHITAESQVWTEGMEAWLPANQIDGFIPAAAPQQTPQINLGTQSALTSVAASPTNPYAAPVAAATAQEGGEYPIPAVNKINIRLYISCLLVGIGLVIVGTILIGSSATRAGEESGSIALPIIIMVIGYIGVLVSSIIQLMAIYRAWAILKPGGGTLSPGMAVGLLFIPFFGPIWIIIVLCKLPNQWNSIMSKYTNTTAAPRLSLGIALCAILIPVIGYILWMQQVAKAINFLVSARLMPGSQQQQQPASPGGIVLR